MIAVKRRVCVFWNVNNPLVPVTGEIIDRALTGEEDFSPQKKSFFGFFSLCARFRLKLNY